MTMSFNLDQIRAAFERTIRLGREGRPDLVRWVAFLAALSPAAALAICPSCKHPITDRDSPNAVVCGRCIDAARRVVEERDRQARWVEGWIRTVLGDEWIDGDKCPSARGLLARLRSGERAPVDPLAAAGAEAPLSVRMFAEADRWEREQVVPDFVVLFVRAMAQEIRKREQRIAELERGT